MSFGTPVKTFVREQESPARAIVVPGARRRPGGVPALK